MWTWRFSIIKLVCQRVHPTVHSVNCVAFAPPPCCNGVRCESSCRCQDEIMLRAVKSDNPEGGYFLVISWWHMIIYISFMYTHIHIYTYMSMSIYIWFVYIYISIYIYIHVYTLFILKYICIYTYLCVCVYSLNLHT